jgi:small subunit ribosomal protein S9
LSQTNKTLAIGVGRRKSAIAQIKIIRGNGEFIINGKLGLTYMQENPSFLLTIQAPLDLLGLQKNYTIIAKVNGGGLAGQADAIRLGVARALCLLEESYRGSLRIKGFLTRDSRTKERRKYGLKKARKAPQFSKR